MVNYKNLKIIIRFFKWGFYLFGAIVLLMMSAYAIMCILEHRAKAPVTVSDYLIIKNVSLSERKDYAILTIENISDKEIEIGEKKNFMTYFIGRHGLCAHFSSLFVHKNNFNSDYSPPSLTESFVFKPKETKQIILNKEVLIFQFSPSKEPTVTHTENYASFEFNYFKLAGRSYYKDFILETIHVHER